MVETMLFERRMTQHEARTIGFALTRSSDEARQELLSLFGVSEDEVTALRGERDYGKAHRLAKIERYLFRRRVRRLLARATHR